MQRRHFHHLGLGAIGSLMFATWQQAHALSLADLSGADAASGVKAALAKGAESAVALLGQNDGFLGNPKVRIPLPGYLEDAAKLMRKFGQGKAIDELVTGMNRAAEAAVPLGKDLLVGAVQLALSGWLMGLPALLFGVVVLVCTWGPRDLDIDVESSMPPIRRHVPSALHGWHRNRASRSSKARRCRAW